MAIIKHTINVPVPGFDALEATFNVAATHAQVTFAERQGRGGSFLLDLPNWDDVALELGLVEIDPATGEPTDRPLPKPSLPLNDEAAVQMPMAVATWLLSGVSLQAAVGDYVGNLSPNVRRR